MLAGPTIVYHFTGTIWEKLANLENNDPSFGGGILVAGPDSGVWVVGMKFISAEGRPGIAAWHYDGSTWTEHSSPLPAGAEIEAAALGGNGVLYLAGTNMITYTGIIWSYNGSQWTDLTPPNPRFEYKALAVTAGGTLVAGGGWDPGGFVRPGGVLQERSGTTWTTISLSKPVEQVSGLSVAPGGTVYAVGMRTTVQPVLIEQRPGSGSATVLDVPAPDPSAGNMSESGVVAVGSGDVWLLGQYGVPNPYAPVYGLTQPWITHFDGSRFFAATAPNAPGEFSAFVGGVSLGSAVLAYARAHPDLFAVCPAQVTRNAIVPAEVRTSIGEQTFWSVPATAASRHELVAPGLFDSGPIGPGGSFPYTFFAAATYAVKDTRTGAAETVRVPPAVTPADGVTSTVYTIACASRQAPVGYAYRLLIERPRSGDYTLLTTTSQPTAAFVPYQGTGTYRFECQVQTPDGVTAVSPPAAVTVS